MTTATRPHLHSLEEWCALGEDLASRVELQEGVLFVSPKPRPAHQEAGLALALQLGPHIPAGHRLTPDVDVVSMEVLTLGADGAYAGGTVTGTLETTVPFDLRIDLAALN